MKKRAVCIVLLLLAIAPLGMLLRSAYADHEHRAAMQAWPELVRQRFQAPTRQLVATFYSCFKRGDAASLYSSILSSAQREDMEPLDDGKGISVYRWYWNRGFNGEGDAFFEVRVYGGIIDACIINPICD